MSPWMDEILEAEHLAKNMDEVAESAVDLV